jgi:hypothetical protein
MLQPIGRKVAVEGCADDLFVAPRAADSPRLTEEFFFSNYVSFSLSKNCKASLAFAAGLEFDEIGLFSCKQC